MRTTAKAWLAGALAALGLWAAPIGAQLTAAEAVPGAPWVKLATEATPKQNVISRIRRPAMKAWTDSYVYGPGIGEFGTEVTFAATIDPNNYDQAVTLYLWWQDRVSQQRRYYNATSGSFSTSEVDLFGTAGDPIQVLVPEIENFVFFGPAGSGSAFGALSGVPSTTGQYQLVLEVRDATGQSTVSFTNALYSYVDELVAVSGDISGGNWTANNVYYLAAPVNVASGTLTIEPGTFVLGSEAGLARLAVLPGAQINASGTNLRPIIFTSEQPRAFRQKGDWGGLIINGNAPCNVQDPIGEGETGTFCGDNPNDNSGTLRFVRVEFAGIRFTDDNELNGIAFQGVGAGTTLENIQVIEGLDDGMEFFGGTANLTNGIVLNAEDDSLDWTFGWTGTVTNFCAVQNFGEADKIIEADSLEDNPNALPRAVPTITNFTGVSNATVGAGANADDALVIRRGSGIRLTNAALIGVPSGRSAVFLGDSDLAADATYDLIGTGDLTFNGVQVQPNNATLIVRADGAPVDAPAGLTNANPRLANPTSLVQPDLQPLAGSTGCTTASNDWTKDYWISWDFGDRQ